MAEYYVMFLYVVYSMFINIHLKNGVICDAIVRAISTYIYCCFWQRNRVWGTSGGMCISCISCQCRLLVNTDYRPVRLPPNMCSLLTNTAYLVFSKCTLSLSHTKAGPNTEHPGPREASILGEPG